MISNPISGVRGRADWVGMRPTARFAQILDEKLAGQCRPERAAAPAMNRATWVPSVCPPLSVDEIPFRRSPVAWAASAYGRPMAGISPEPTRPTRRRSPAERAALECLRGFGAGLEEACSDEELRSAFRHLALRFHPDRHPEVADADREYLASAFGRITQAYRVLVPRTH